MRDVDGNVDRMRVDLDHLPQVLAALDTTAAPTTQSAVRIRTERSENVDLTAVELDPSGAPVASGTAFAAAIPVRDSDLTVTSGPGLPAAAPPSPSPSRRATPVGATRSRHSAGRNGADSHSTPARGLEAYGPGAYALERDGSAESGSHGNGMGASEMNGTGSHRILGNGWPSSEQIESDQIEAMPTEERGGTP